ncbi:LPD25 domain-containing protein, partial [Clostridium perfringens]
LNTERELTKENELVNSLSDKNIKNESELNLEMEGEMDFESGKFIEIKDENIREFLRTDKVVIHEVSKSELEELVDNNKSFIWFKAEKGSEVNSDIFTSENHVIAVKEKGVYQDVYIRKNYDLENLIYVDDKKNLYKVKNNENEGEKNINKFEKIFNIEYSNKEEIEINTNELLNSDIEKMEVLKERINKENILGRDQSKDCRIDYGILKTFSERFNEKVELLDKLGINHAGIEKVDKEEIVKYSEKAKFPEVGEVKIFKSESINFKENQILPFNEANSLFEKEEAYVRELKREYEKKGEYYPYEKVKGEVKINDNVDFEFRYDIGDGKFYNLADLLER